MVGMRMGFQYPFDLQALLLHEADDFIGRCGAGVTGFGIVIEDRIDDRAFCCLRCVDYIADGTGFSIEEGVHDRRHGRFLAKGAGQWDAAGAGRVAAAGG
ncbi:hypothetical protein D3C81_1706140 [compost metagenome]